MTVLEFVRYFDVFNELTFKIWFMDNNKEYPEYTGDLNHIPFWLLECEIYKELDDRLWIEYEEGKVVVTIRCK
ncbi:MAG: hypothetical protein MJ126_05795 [Lachnospiraceae bacterium]|nr:hypothetical protein [Lachnospiraceae bacterium]